MLEVTGHGQPFCLHFQQAEQFLLLTFLVESCATHLHLTHQISLSFGFMISYLQLHSLKLISVLLNSSKLSSHVVDWGFCAVRSFTCFCAVRSFTCFCAVRSFTCFLNTENQQQNPTSYTQLCKLYQYLCSLLQNGLRYFLLSEMFFFITSKMRLALCACTRKDMHCLTLCDQRDIRVPLTKSLFESTGITVSYLFLHAAIYLEVSLFHWTSQNAFSHVQMILCAMLLCSIAHSIICTRLFHRKMHSDLFKGIEILQGRWQHGEKVGCCYPSWLEKTLCKWDIHVPLVTKGLMC